MNDKKYYWTAAIVVVAVIAGVIIYKHYDKTHNPSGSTGSDQVMSQDQTAASGTNASTGGSGTKKLSYEQAITTYKNRFQFSQCHGTPGFISVRAGTPVMLDNRDNTAHTIKANGQSVRIAALDYAVIYPSHLTSDSTSPESSNVTCDGGGAATLNVEK